MAQFLFGVIQVAVGVWFLWAASSKARSWSSHVQALRAYTLVADRTAPHLAILLVSAESALGIALVVGIGSPWTVVLASTLLVAITAAVAVDLLRGELHDCGCGAGGARISWALVARNLLAAVALLVTLSLPLSTEPSARMFGALAVLGAGLVATAAKETIQLTSTRATSRS